MNLFAGREWKCRYREWTCGHSRGRREWDKWRNSTDIYTAMSLDWIVHEVAKSQTRLSNFHFTSCVKWTAGEKLLYNMGSSAWHFLMI